MITLTREEAQQVLEHLDDLVEAQQWEIDMHITQYGEEYKPHRVKHMREKLANTNSTIETLRARLSAPERNCTRSHPHENMDVMCELRTEIARLTNENARLKSQPEPEPVTDKYLMEVECTKCGAKQDGVLTVTVPPQPEPHCKTGSQCIGGKCPQCVVSEPEPVAWNIKHNRPPLSSDNPHEVVAVIKREWQGLTEAERLDILDAELTTQSTEHFALTQAIEAKLKEKNT